MLGYISKDYAKKEQEPEKKEANAETPTTTNTEEPQKPDEQQTETISNKVLKDTSINYNSEEIIPESNVDGYFVWVPRYKYQIFNLGNYTPTRTDYSFKGWSTNSSATTGSTSSVTINAAITYYAIWKQIFTVTWNLQGGNINGDTSNKTESVESGSTVSFTKYTPVKTGYTFNGWATSSAATSGSTTGNSTAITADTTFYATWKSAILTPILLILAE